MIYFNEKTKLKIVRLIRLCTKFRNCYGRYTLPIVQNQLDATQLFVHWDHLAIQEAAT